MKTKVFLGDDNNRADDQFNAWIEDHADIHIVEFKYCQSRYHYHSICILYKEKYV